MQKHGNLPRSSDEVLSQDKPYKFSVPVFGPGVIYDAPLGRRKQQIKFIAGSLHKQQLDRYVPEIIREAETFFAEWGESGVVDIREQLSQLIILTASRVLMGPEVC